MDLVGGQLDLRGPRGPPGPPGPKSGGAIYIRWGKSTCPTSAGAELVYSGIAGGSFFYTRGGGANYLCLPKEAQYSPNLSYRSGYIHASRIQGAEYQHPTNGVSKDQNVPCAVCHVPSRTTLLVIPARYTCPSSWTREYYGYLMSEYRTHHRSTFECVDIAMEHLPGGHANTDGALFYHTECHCNHGIPCPPYIDHKELNCVVCTK